MNDVFVEYARTEAPKEFSACVQTACKRAVALPAGRPVRRPHPVLLLAALLLLAGGAAAAVINWMAGDLFTEETGFMLPDYEWGSSSSIPRENVLSFYGCTAGVRYQYDQDALICIDIVFNRQNQPSGVIPDSLAEQILTDMTRLYGEPADLSPQVDGARLQQILRQELGIEDPEKSDAERMRDALLAAGADSGLADHTYDAVEQSHGSVRQYKWTHEATNTAAWLSISCGKNQDVRVLEISLACLNF